MQWLGAFFTAFPVLKSKKIHLLGESYAGVFVCYEFTSEINIKADWYQVPYIAQAIRQQQATLGINITSIGMGDSTWGNVAALTDVVTTSFIKKHLNNYGTQMYDPFECSF